MLDTDAGYLTHVSTLILTSQTGKPTSTSHVTGLNPQSLQLANLGFASV